MGTLRSGLLVGLVCTMTLLAHTCQGGSEGSAQWYISPSGSNMNNGTSPTSPFLTLRYALDASAVGDTICALAGTYTGDQNTALTISGRSLIGVGPGTIFAGSGRPTSEQEIQLLWNNTSPNDEFVFSLTNSASLQNAAVVNSTILVRVEDQSLMKALILQNANFGIYYQPASLRMESDDSLEIRNCWFGGDVEVGVSVFHDVSLLVDGCQFHSLVGVAMGQQLAVGNITRSQFFGSHHNSTGIWYVSDDAGPFDVSHSGFQNFAGPDRMITGNIGSLTNVTFLNNSCTNCSIVAHQSVSQILARDNQVYCLFIGQTVASSTFDGNQGPVLCFGTAMDSAFSNNYGSDYGGALLESNAQRCTFSNNTAQYGGAMAGGYAELSTFVNNSAISGGAGLNMDAKASNFSRNQAKEYGGAIYFTSWNPDPVASSSFYTHYGIDECLFEENSAGVAGGAFSGLAINFLDCEFAGNQAPLGGGVCLSAYTNSVNLLRISFLSNQATQGGAAYFEDRYTGYFLDQIVFRNNSALQDGGAIYVPKLTVPMTLYLEENILFIENSAPNGGAMYLGNNIEVYASQVNFTSNKAVLGGAIYSKGSHAAYVSFQQCLFLSNTAQSGGALYLHSTLWEDASNVYAYNSAQSGGVAWINKGSPQFYQSLMVDNSAPMGGAILLQHKAQALITDVVFVDNRGQSGSAVYCDDSTQQYRNVTLLSQSPDLIVECSDCETTGLHSTLTNC